MRPRPVHTSSQHLTAARAFIRFSTDGRLWLRSFDEITGDRWWESAPDTAEMREYCVGTLRYFGFTLRDARDAVALLQLHPEDPATFVPETREAASPDTPGAGNVSGAHTK